MSGFAVVHRVITADCQCAIIFGHLSYCTFVPGRGSGPFLHNTRLKRTVAAALPAREYAAHRLRLQLVEAVRGNPLGTSVIHLRAG